MDIDESATLDAIRRSTAKELDNELIVAARAGRLEVIALLGKGASATARDEAGVSAIDHAARNGHSIVACILERAAVSGHESADLFLAVFDHSPDRIREAAARIDLEARTEDGLTALMLAARHLRHDAVRALVSLGARIDQRNGTSTALVYAIESGDVRGMLLLLDLGAGLNPGPGGENPVLAAACKQPDSDLLEYLLVRGLDITSSTDQVAAKAGAARLLRDARAGRLPSWAGCPVCRELPGRMGWCDTMRGDSTGEPLPAVTQQFETFSDLWKCPQCSTYYEYERDHDNGIPDGWDREDLTRISLEKALEKLQAMESAPRIEHEISAVTKRISP